MKKQIIHVTMACILLFGVTAPLATQVYAEDTDGSEKLSINELSASEKLEILMLQLELKSRGITEEDIQSGLRTALPALPPDDGFTQQGVKSKAAKVAAKKMIKNLNRIGRVAWDRSVREYVNKLPITSGAKSVLRKYLGYQFVMETLNVVVNLEGTITDALTKYLKKLGLSNWMAGMTARAIVLLLF